MTMSLAFLASDIVEAAVRGALPRRIGITRLADLRQAGRSNATFWDCAKLLEYDRTRLRTARTGLHSVPACKARKNLMDHGDNGPRLPQKSGIRHHGDFVPA